MSLLVDEPLSNLDARLLSSMREDIRGLQQSPGVIVVYVIHKPSAELRKS